MVYVGSVITMMIIICWYQWMISVSYGSFRVWAHHLKWNIQVLINHYSLWLYTVSTVMSFTCKHSCSRPFCLVLAVPLIHQQNIHIITNTGKACSAAAAQILYFVWLPLIHAGHWCKRYPRFSSPAPTRLATTTQPPGFVEFFSQQKKTLSWLKKSISCLCVLWMKGRRRGGGGGWRGWALSCMKYPQLSHPWNVIPF